MGREVTFNIGSAEVGGYLAEPTGSGPGIIIIHEWWGVDSPLSNIRELADRLAQEGFVAFAPDFYRGKTADNPDDAGALMTDMFQNRMEEVDTMFKCAVEGLRESSKVDPKKIGVTGFCCGGTLSMYFASKFSHMIDASVPFYGLPQLAPVNPSDIKIPIFFVMAEKDEFVNNDEVIDLAKEVWKNGVEVQMKVYPGVNHAFLNTKRPEVYDEKTAEDAWKMAIEFFRRHLV